MLPLLPAWYRAFAVDQRGFGDSERPDRGYGIEDMAADAVAFLDAVGVERATVVGHSFGSFVARRVAVAHPERVSRLVLIDSGFSPANAVTRSVQESLRDLADPVPKGFARDFQASTAYLPLPAAFFERIVAEGVKLPSRLWRAAFDGLLASDDTAELAGIRASTLLLWGDRDALFPSTINIGSRARSRDPGFASTRRPDTARTGSAPSGWQPISSPSCKKTGSPARRDPPPPRAPCRAGRGPGDRSRPRRHWRP